MSFPNSRGWVWKATKVIMKLNWKGLIEQMIIIFPTGWNLSGGERENEGTEGQREGKIGRECKGREKKEYK